MTSNDEESHFVAVVGPAAPSPQLPARGDASSGRGAAAQEHGRCRWSCAPVLSATHSFSEIVSWRPAVAGGLLLGACVDVGAVAGAVVVSREYFSHFALPASAAPARFSGPGPPPGPRATTALASALSCHERESASSSPWPAGAREAY